MAAVSFDCKAYQDALLAAPCDLRYFFALQSVQGQELAYLPGKETMTAAIVTMQPGKKTGWYRDEAPAVCHGPGWEMSLDYGKGIDRRFVKEDMFIEAFQTSHEGTNTGNSPVRILAVFAGSDSVNKQIMAR